jgi:hypothetical protein
VITTTDAPNSMVSTKSTENEMVIPSAITLSSARSGTVNKTREIYSRATLERALSTDPAPLLQFAARKDFTGENIIFLISLCQWRACWDQAVRDINGVITQQAKRQLFHYAVQIYVTSVHMKMAAFPINIEGRVRLRLNNIFRGAIWSLEHTSRTSNETDIFSTHYCTAERTSKDLSLPTLHLGDMRPRLESSSSLKTLVKHSLAETCLQNNTPDELSIEMLPGSSDSAIPIPDGFDAHVFDDAEQEVKYMVLTNTWPRFVDSIKLHENTKIWSRTV